MATRRPRPAGEPRREQILRVAADLFAKHGFHGVSVGDIGAACGMSGPALYKHFAGKQELLAEMLVSVSDELLAEGKRQVRAAADDEAALASLIAWHADFALAHTALIVVQDRDWSALPDQAREQVRAAQRSYVALWSRTLRKIRPDLTPTEARASAHATFGLINSTPHSALLAPDQMHSLLCRMAAAALR